MIIEIQSIFLYCSVRAKKVDRRKNWHLQRINALIGLGAGRHPPLYWSQTNFTIPDRKRISSDMWLKIYFRYPIISQTPKKLSSVTKIPTMVKHTCTLFSASTLDIIFKVFSRTTSRPYVNTLADTVESDCPSQYIDSWTHSVSTENRTLHKSLTRAPKIQNHTLQNHTVS